MITHLLSAFPKFYWRDRWPPGRERLRLSKKAFGADSRNPDQWVAGIEFVADISDIGMGMGGWREDQMFYANAAGI